MPNIRQTFRTHGRTIYSVTAVIAATVIACVLIKTLAPTDIKDHRNPQIPNSGAVAGTGGASGPSGTTVPTIPAVPEGTQGTVGTIATGGSEGTVTTPVTAIPVIYSAPAGTAGTDVPTTTEGTTSTTVPVVATTTTTTTAPGPVAFSSGSVTAVETDKPPSICPTNVQCVSQYTWTLTGGTVANGVFSIIQDSVVITGPPGQTECDSTEVIENTDSGSTISVTSDNCTTSGTAAVGTNGMSYSAPGYLTTTLYNRSYSGSEWIWSN